MDKRDLAIYIHVPFCKSRCHYCDFLSNVACDVAIEKYVVALVSDIKGSGSLSEGYIVKTIFFGGGTPSLLSEKQLGDVLQAIKNTFTLDPNVYISIEINPDAKGFGGFLVLKDLGFSRISFGVQSFDNGELAMLGRIHSSEEAVDAVLEAYEAGFRDINVDLMFGLPNQAIESLAKTLKTATSLPITHISCYSLTVEEGTPLASNHALLDKMPEEDAERAMYHHVKGFLAGEGFGHYEISNWAKEGFECKHNKTYWTGGEYLGLGLGASSYLNKARLKKTDDVGEYLAGGYDLIHIEDIDQDEEMREFVILGLRMLGGISVAEFQRRFAKGIFEVFGEVLREMIEEGFLEQEGDKIRLTSKGLDLANVVMGAFI